MNALISKLKAARACSTPLLMVTTIDQPAVVAEIKKELNGKSPIVSWDRVNGFLAVNEKGEGALQHLVEQIGISAEELPIATCEPHNAFRHAANLPGHTILVAYSLNRFLREEQAGSTVQSILNLRDLFKGNQRTLIGLSPSFDVPSEIQHDVIMLDDPLPSTDGYAQIICDMYESANLKKPSEQDETVLNGVRSVRGLSAFEAEQVISMAIASTGFKNLDLKESWQLKIGAVSKIKGLTMTLDGPSLKDLRGLDAIIGSLNSLWDGPEPPELVVRVDEIDKLMAGLGTSGGPGDNTGVSQDLLQNFLVSMEDYGWLGAILVGIRGSGKTILTQSIGVAHGVPTIAMDGGAMKGKHVGESEQAFRDAFRTIRSIGGSRVIVLATCNKLENIPAELMRRFKLGVVFFDLLTKEERDALWPIYLKKYNHALNAELPNDDGWTGAEIRNCCEIAYKTRKSVKEVGETMIVPVTKSDRGHVDSLRNLAENRFLSASYPGTYKRIQAAPEPQKRKFN